MRRSAVTPLAILVAVLAALVVAVIAAGPASGGDQDPSSTANGKAGTLALYQWLAATGDTVHRDDSSFDLGGSDVLISAAPLDQYAYSRADDATLTAFLSGGGDAILAIDDPASAEAVLRPLGITAAPTDLADASPSQPFPGSSGIHSVPLAPPEGGTAVWSFAGGGGRLVPLLSDADATVAAAIQVGHGRLLLVGSSYPLSNDGLRRGDAAAFVLALVGDARGNRVVFDDFHHLAPAGASDQGLSAVFQGPLLAALLLAVAVLLLYLLTSGRRLGRPVPRRDPGRVPSVLDHISAVGHLLSRSRDRGGVAARYADELKLRVGRATGVEPHLTDAEFTERLAGFGERRAQAAGSLLHEARRLAAGRPGEAELLGLARKVDALESEWGVIAIR